MRGSSERQPDSEEICHTRLAIRNPKVFLNEKESSSEEGKRFDIYGKRNALSVRDTDRQS